MSTMPTQRQQLEDVVGTHIEAQTRPTVHAPSQGQAAGRRADPTQIKLRLERIRPDEDQVRKFGTDKDDPELQQLAQSIKDVGILQQVVVRYIREDDCYELISGERRYRAARLAGLDEIPAKVINVSEEEVVKLQLIENIHRQDLSPVDLGAALQRMVDEGSSINELAVLLHKSKPWVQKALTIHRRLSSKAKEQAKEAPDSYQLAHLYEVSQLPEDQQQGVMRRIKTEKLTERGLRDVTAAVKKKSRSTNRGRPSKTKPYSKTVKTDNGASITIRFRKARVAKDEVVTALREAARLVAA